MGFTVFFPPSYIKLSALLALLIAHVNLSLRVNGQASPNERAKMIAMGMLEEEPQTDTVHITEETLKNTLLRRNQTFLTHAYPILSSGKT